MTLPRLIFVILTTLYLSLSCYQLDLPGLHYDEAFEAVPALQLWQGVPVTAFRESGLYYNGQTFPLMTQDYIGAINSYTTIPFIALLGPTPTALRLMSVLIGLITLWLVYLLTSYLASNRYVGLIAMALVVVDPTFIFWNRQGIFVTAVTATIGLAATYCWLHRLQGGSWRWGIAGTFLFGFGLYAKFLFLWLLVALTISFCCYGGYQWLTNKTLPVTPPTLPELLSLTVAFIIGCGPLLHYNWQTQGTYLAITQNAETSYYGVDNTAFLTNLGERLYQYLILLNGGHLWYLGDIIANPLPPLLFIVVVSLIFLFTTIRIVNREPLSSLNLMALLPLMVISLVILMSIVTVSALWITHYALIMPWAAITIAVGGWFCYQQSMAYLTRFTCQAIAGLTIIVLLSTNFVGVVSYHRALTESGGLSTHSDAVYDLSNWLQNQPNHPVAAMDWGLSAPIIYLTNGKVQPTELFGYQWQTEVDLTTRFAIFIEHPNTFYLWRAPDEVIFDRSREFKDYYRPFNLEETIEEAFYERSGRPLLGVTRLVPQGSAINPP